MKHNNLVGVVISSWIVLGATTAAAQTAISTPKGTIPPVPVPQSVVDQAERQANGNFSSMKRSAVGGQIQEAWNDTDDDAGITQFEFCGLCTYKVRLREHMITLFEVPSGEIIERIDNGDDKTFTINMRGDQRFAVQAVGYGVDTNLIVYGKSGNIYPFYVRAERFNSKNIPDQFVQIIGGRISQEINVSGTIGGNVKGLATDPLPEDATDLPSNPPTAKPADVANLYDDLPKPWKGPEKDDFIEEVPFNPDTLHGWGNYNIWGGGDDHKSLIPKTVFRDDHFTYIKFGDKWNDIELPAAYVVLDKVDELVNTRIQGHTYIIESTQRLITLKSGLSYLCIEFTGEP